MSGFEFSDKRADIQRSVAQCQDQVYRRSLVMDAMQLRSGERVLEIGCGGGSYAYEAGLCVGPTGLVFAVDSSVDQIEAARSLCADMAWIECQLGNAAELSFESGMFDVVYGIQVFEFIDSLSKTLSEVQRVLRTGGRLFVLSTDWDTATWYSGHPERMQKVLNTWGTHLHTANLPSIIGTKLQQVGLETLKQTPLSFLNRSYHKNSFSYWASRVIYPFIKGKSGITAEEADAWIEEFDTLEQQQAYFFCLTSVLTEAVKTAR